MRFLPVFGLFDLHYLREAVEVSQNHGSALLRQELKKALFYSLMIADEAEVDMNHVDVMTGAGAYRISTEEEQQVTAKLMEHISDHFSPILFQPASASHMACTEVLAGSWMDRVVQPALSDGWVFRPFEALNTIKGMDWAGSGNEGDAVCEACMAEKRAEWDEEAMRIWKMMDTWIVI